MNKALVTTLLIVSFAAHAENELIPDEVKKGWNRVFPGTPPHSVSKTSIPNIYEIVLGNQIFYLTGDGQYLMTGEIYQTLNGKSLTKDRKNQINRKVFENVDMTQVVSYSKPGYQHTVNVFTDVDCGYCRRFHKNMAAINDAGIKINYFFMPRSPEARKKAVSVWCAKDRKKAMNMAKAGVALAEKTCSNPVATHLDLARRLGVTGTPSIFLKSGASPGGYLDPAALLREIKKDEARLRG